LYQIGKVVTENNTSVSLYYERPDKDDEEVVPGSSRSFSRDVVLDGKHLSWLKVDPNSCPLIATRERAAGKFWSILLVK